jgi:hypothetical protein
LLASRTQVISQGYSGEQTKAMGLVYEITGDMAILDQMISFCDAVLSERNDLAPDPVGQYVIWTGRIDPVCPNNVSTTPIGTGGEQGDPVGHLGNCARLILSTPSIADMSMGIGDLYGFGAHLDRAKTFVAGADLSIDQHILASLLDLSDGNRQFFSSASPYMPGHRVPWNQQMMFNYGFQNLAVCHTLLSDDDARAALYDSIVQASMDWFFSSGVQTYQDSGGNTAYNWGYALPSTSGEDSNHGSLDVSGFYRPYLSGRSGITAGMMAPFANVCGCDVARASQLRGACRRYQWHGARRTHDIHPQRLPFPGRVSSGCVLRHDG